MNPALILFLTAAITVTTAHVNHIRNQLSLTPAQTVTMSNGVNLIHGFIAARGKLWGCTYSTPTYLVRWNDTNDLTNYDLLQFPRSATFGGTGTNDHYGAIDLVYSAGQDKIYVVFDLSLFDSKCLVSEVDPATLAFTDVTHFIQPYSSQSLAADASNLYVIAMNSTNSIINKLDFATWSTNVNLPIGIPTGHALRYDGTNLFATLGITNAFVAKIAPGPLTLTATNAFQAGDQRPTDDLTFTATDVWVGLEDQAAVCLKISKADLSITRVPVNQPDGSYGMWYDGVTVWDLIKSSPGRLLAINPDTLAQQTFTLTEDTPNEIAGDLANLWITYWQSPAKIQRLSRP